MKKAILIVFFIVGCLGCTNKETLVTNDDPLELFENGKKIKGEIVHLDKEMLGMPAYRMVKMDSLLLILDWLNVDDKFLFVVDLKNKKLLKKIIRVGWGPNEFSLLEGIKKNDIIGNKINFMDPNKKQYFELSSSELLGNTDMVAPKLVVTFKDDNNALTSYTDVLQISDDNYIGYAPQSGEAMFSIVDSSGSVTKNLHQFPGLGAGIDNSIAGQIYYGEIHKQSSGNRIACVAQPGLLEILEYKDNQLEIISQFETIMPSFTLRENRPIKKGDSKMGYVFSSVSEKYIYIGYDDKPMQQSGASCKYVLVFDWEGKPKTLLELDHSIVAFTVDEDDSKIYAVANIPEPKIITYSIEL